MRGERELTVDDSSIDTIWDFIVKFTIFFLPFKEDTVIPTFPFKLQLDNFVFIQVVVIANYSCTTANIRTSL